jgi:hypothetical protein
MLPNVGDTPLNGLAIVSLGDPVELHHMRSGVNAKMLGHIARSFNQSDSFRYSSNLKPETFRKDRDVRKAFAIQQARELAQCKYDAFEECTECPVMPDARHSEHVSVRLAKC